MREPYESIILSRDEQFRQLGLRVSVNREFQIIYTDLIQVIFNTERYYHPTLTVAITDLKSNRRELGLLEQIVDPGLAERHRAAITDFTLVHNFQHTDVAVLKADGSFKRYIELILDQTLEFLEVYKLRGFSLSPEEESTYLAADRVSLRRFGIS